MNNPTSIKAGFVQFDVKPGDIESNLQSVQSSIKRLSDKGAQVAVLPELWPCGFDNLKIAGHAEKSPELIDCLRQLAQRHHMIIAGSLPEKSGGHIFNTMVVIDKDGSIPGEYRKIHLFSSIGEDAAFSAGDRAVVCKTSAGPVGLMICYDLRFPELCRLLALSGARLVIVSAQWPESRINHWDILLCARAVENQIFIVAANRVGRDDPLTFNGHSQIISPSGEVLVKIADQASEGLAEINFNDIDTCRKQFNCLKERVPEAYKL